MKQVTTMDRAILNVLSEGPSTVIAIAHRLWGHTGVEFSETSVRRCLLRMSGLRVVDTVGLEGKAVVWSRLRDNGGNKS